MGGDFLIGTPLTRFLAQTVGIVAVSRLLGVVARRFGQPMVIAEIIAGIVLGPSLLGWVAPEVVSSVFTPTRGILHVASEIGLILFMFLVGLELDLELLRGRGRASLAISQAGIVVPFALGSWLALVLHPFYAPEGVKPLPFALFLGAAMSVTAFPVLARILSERRLLNTPMGATTIACAAIDDISAWCILAFVVAIARTTGLEAAALTTGLALGYAGLMILVVRPLGVKLATQLPREGDLNQNVVATLLVGLLVSSWIADVIGIHAVFGAFLFGAILPKRGGLAAALVDKLEDLVLVLLLPLFFAYSGLRTQVGLLDSAGEWGTCGLFMLVAVLGKFGASALAARLTGSSWREAGALGVLMNTRGLMELIVLNIGLDLGVLTPTLFTMMVIIALVTTFAATPVLGLFYPPARVTRDLLAAASQKIPEARQKADANLLICVSRGAAGPALVDVALGLRDASGTTEVQALHLQHLEEAERNYASGGHQEDKEQALSLLAAHAEQAGLSLRTLSFPSDTPDLDICNLAEARGTELILLSGHSSRTQRARIGQVAHSVLRRASADVGILFERGSRPAKRVLVLLHGSPHDRAAVEVARRMERASGAILRLVSVDAHLENQLGEYDLIVVGIGAEWQRPERRYGGHVERLLEQASSSVLVVRGGNVEAAPSRINFLQMMPQGL